MNLKRYPPFATKSLAFQPAPHPHSAPAQNPCENFMTVPDRNVPGSELIRLDADTESAIVATRLPWGSDSG